MLLHIVAATHVDNYCIEVAFNDGKSGIADFSEVVQQGVFTQLSNPEDFSKLHVDTELKTITWPNGADLAPEFVYFQAFKHDPSLADQFKSWGYAD